MLRFPKKLAIRWLFAAILLPGGLSTMVTMQAAEAAAAAAAEAEAAQAYREAKEPYTCGICQQSLTFDPQNQGQRATTIDLDCNYQKGHRFHLDCIIQQVRMMRDSPNKFNCPLCSTPFPDDIKTLLNRRGTALLLNSCQAELQLCMQANQASARNNALLIENYNTLTSNYFSLKSRLKKLAAIAALAGLIYKFQASP
jgi:transcription elongation factor Elf1